VVLCFAHCTVLVTMTRRKKERDSANYAGGRRRRHDNQQRHVTAAESRRWRDVINRHFPRNVAAAAAEAIKAKRSTTATNEHGRTCLLDAEQASASERDNNRRPACAGAVRDGRVNHANASAPCDTGGLFARCRRCRSASALLFR